MTLKHVFSSLMLLVLLTACQVTSDTDTEADVEMDNGASSSEMNDDLDDMDSMDEDDLDDKEEMKEMDEDDKDEMADEDDKMMQGKSSLTFVGASSVNSHTGGFSDFTVDVGNKEDLVNSTVTATVDMTSIYTDSNGLTGHLQKEDFFDTATYSTATFTSTDIQKSGDSYNIVGDLTLKGVTKSIVMTATLEGNKFMGSFDIPRKEFGVGNDSYGDKLLNELVPVKAVVYLQ